MRKCFFDCNRLVRDKKPLQLLGREIACETRDVRPHERLSFLKEKLLEEAYEAGNASSISDLMRELIDVEDVVEAIKHELHVSDGAFQQRLADRREKAGRFDRGICLTKVSLDEDHPDISGYVCSRQYRPVRR